MTRTKYWVMLERELDFECDTLKEAKERAKRFKWGARVFKVQEMVSKKSGGY